MSNNTPVTSTIFNEKFGDFALLSSDGITFFMPRVIIQHSSKVFAAMFEVGKPEENNAPIKTQAESAILELLFTFLHPGMPNPIIKDLATLVEIIKVATQYEMELVLSNLQACFFDQKVPKSQGSRQSIIKAEPLASLAVAYEFSLSDIIVAALREVLKGDLGAQLLAAEQYELPLSVLGKVYKLREERVDWYSSKVLYLCSLADSNVYGIGGQIRDHYKKWREDALKAIRIRPNINTLKGLHSKAAKEGFFNVTQTWSQISVWEAEALQMEESFSELKHL